MKKVFYVFFTFSFALVLNVSSNAQLKPCSFPSKCLELVKKPVPPACDLEVKITDGAAVIMDATGIRKSGNKLTFSRQVEDDKVLTVWMQGSPEHPNKSFTIRATGKNQLEIKIVECDDDEMVYTVKNGILDTEEKQ